MKYRSDRTANGRLQFMVAQVSRPRKSFSASFQASRIELAFTVQIGLQISDRLE
jgi:hypothetical protein